MGPIGKGAIALVIRDAAGETFSARVIGMVAIYSAVGIRDECVDCRGQRSRVLTLDEQPGAAIIDMIGYGHTSGPLHDIGQNGDPVGTVVAAAHSGNDTSVVVLSKGVVERSIGVVHPDRRQWRWFGQAR